ncbi:hypothetical protein GALMADRAFT_159190 [Galerina marginata CBS 339.88]|uniref:Uncharacterized protein n=1 Tax=Galerina marginata (strain CBS 339.88) TaxID=685588 RepID=A0A067SLF1_GALM3|nr:hypothetical protein GALMADRAFT_159190 [Galerina marginata CBS 339.88]
MDKTTSILGALEAGKLPTTQQFGQFIDWLNGTVIPSVEPDSSSELSEQGRVLAVDVRRVLEAYKQLAKDKNPDNILQETLYTLSHTDPSLPAPSTHATQEKDKALADLSALHTSLRHILIALWESISLEGTSLSNDLLSAVRLSLADAAALVEGGAGSVKESLRGVEEEVQEGKRDALGRDKERMEEEEDVKVAWEHGMDTVKGAGSTVIGAAQDTKETVDEKMDEGSERLQEAFYKISDRAHSNPEYRRSLSTLLGILQSRLHRTLSAFSSPDATLSSFFSSPSDKPTLAALGHLRVLLERLANDTPLQPLLDAAKACVRAVAADEELKTWFDDLFGFARKTLEEPAKAVGAPKDEEEGRKLAGERKELYRRWGVMLEKKENGKWKTAVENLKSELDKLQSGLERDADLVRVREAQARLGDDLERVLGRVSDQLSAKADNLKGKLAGAGGEESAMGRAMDVGRQMGQEVVQGAVWFWHDMFKVYVPRMLGKMRDVPIPRTEYKDAQIEFVLENLDISSFNLLPSHVYIRNITDVDISSSPSTSTTNTSTTTTKVGTLTHIKIQALQLTLKDVSFWYKDKTATLGPAEYTGLLGMRVPRRGVEVDVKVRYVPPSSQPRSGKSGKGVRKETQGHYHTIEHLSVSLAPESSSTTGAEDEEGGDFSVSVKESNHPLLVTLFKPAVTSHLRSALERALEAQLRASIEWVDGVVWDVGRRREVFEDAGFGRGRSVVPALWSEVGRWQRRAAEGGGGWQLTGTGVVVETESTPTDTEGGEGGTQKTQFAMGAEPQILSGEKRGPLGTGSEPLRDVAQRMAEDVKSRVPIDMDVDLDLDVAGGMDVDPSSASSQVASKAKDAARSVGEQAKGVVGQVREEVEGRVRGVKGEVDGFWRSVERKRGEEERVGKGAEGAEGQGGWKSAAFDF